MKSLWSKMANLSDIRPPWTLKTAPSVRSRIASFQQKTGKNVLSHRLTVRDYPPFEKNDCNLLVAGQATACLVVRERLRDGTYKNRYSTAFFVTSTRLITAGHNVRMSHDAEAITDIRIYYAGWKEVTKDTNTLDCHVTGILYDGGPAGQKSSKTDIAILECPNHNAVFRLKLAGNVATLREGAFVDIIGYPQQLKDEQKDGIKDLGVTPTNLEDAGKMLPASTLTATRGRVKRIEDGVFLYNNSTVPGMSGACVVFNGLVYGTTISILQDDFNPTGVHLGQSDKLNHAISFESPEIRRFLREHVIETYITNEDFVEVVAGTSDM